MIHEIHTIRSLRLMKRMLWDSILVLDQKSNHCNSKNCLSYFDVDDELKAIAVISKIMKARREQVNGS